MNRTITAIYENGVLRPLDAVHLTERQTVRIQIVDQDDSQLMLALHELAVAGLITPPQSHSDEDAPSEETRDRVAEALTHGPGRSASEFIIEERGAR